MRYSNKNNFLLCNVCNIFSVGRGRCLFTYVVMTIYPTSHSMVYQAANDSRVSPRTNFKTGYTVMVNVVLLIIPLKQTTTFTLELCNLLFLILG